jgi:hypothetical protein
MTSSDDLPHLTAVCLLQAYAEILDEGNDCFKKSLWNLNKARRQMGRGTTLSAMDLREELRAQTVLRESTPDLAVEGSKTPNEESDEDCFQLVDAKEELAAIRQKVDSTNKSKEGLRNRKASEGEKTEEWTEETSPDEEDRLRSVDPIELFGALTPRDLKGAQQDAKKALEAYVQAANLAVAILRLTDSKKK